MNPNEVPPAGNDESCNEGTLRFGHSEAWSRELGIPVGMVRKRLKKLEGMTGKTHTGRVLKNGFYPEDEVREALQDVLSRSQSEEGANTGITAIQGRLVVGLSAYFTYLGTITVTTIKKLVKEAGLQPVQVTQVVSRGRPVPVYWKDEIDKIIPYTLDDTGEIELDGKTATTFNAYRKKHGLGYRCFVRIVNDAGIKPIPRILALAGANTIPLYWKDELDGVRPRTLGDNKRIDINGRIAVPAEVAACKLGVTAKALWRRIGEEGLKPVPDVQVRTVNHIVGAYWMDDLERIAPKRLNAQGEVRIGNSIAVALSPYAKYRGDISVKTLMNLVEDAGLIAVPGVSLLSNRNNVPVYWKDQVDALLQERADQFLSEQGIINLMGVPAVGLRAYAKHIGTPYATLRKWALKKAGLKSIGEAKPLSGYTIPVYSKEEVDNVLRDHGSLK